MRGIIIELVFVVELLCGVRLYLVNYMGLNSGVYFCCLRYNRYSKHPGKAVKKALKKPTHNILF